MGANPVNGFAGRLNELFESVHPPDRGAYTNAEVAAALTQSGYPMSKPYLSQLRTGQRHNPSDRAVAALAQFFKVEPDYFFADANIGQTGGDREVLHDLQTEGLRRFLLTAFDLSEENQVLLTNVAERLRASEGRGW